MTVFQSIFDCLSILEVCQGLTDGTLIIINARSHALVGISENMADLLHVVLLMLAIVSARASALWETLKSALSLLAMHVSLHVVYLLLQVADLRVLRFNAGQQFVSLQVLVVSE